jgi:hypothetical protein
MTYKFQREDNGAIVEVDFETAMSQQAGFITLPGGVLARRVQTPTAQKTSDAPKKLRAEIVSDTLGVTETAVREYQADAQRNGFSGVEFVRDKHEPTFYQCKVGSVAEWRKYIEHRGLSDKNSRNGGGATLSPQTFERVRQRLLAQTS